VKVGYRKFSERFNGISVEVSAGASSGLPSSGACSIGGSGLDIDIDTVPEVHDLGESDPTITRDPTSSRLRAGLFHEINPDKKETGRRLPVSHDSTKVAKTAPTDGARQ
jgi:hypothetical protein